MSEHYKAVTKKDIFVEGERFRYLRVFNDLAESAQRFIDDVTSDIEENSRDKFQYIVEGAITNGGLSRRRIAADLKVSYSTFERWTVGASAPVSLARPIVMKHLILMAKETIQNADNMLRADFIFDDGYDSGAPWYNSFVLTEGGGFFSDGLEAASTHNVFNRVSGNKFICVMGKHNLVLNFDTASGVQCEINRGGEKTSLSLAKINNPFTLK